jgi:hypothetical protein
MIASKQKRKIQQKGNIPSKILFLEEEKQKEAQV